MTLYLFYILASTLWCVGIFASAMPDMILYDFFVYMEGGRIGKPIINCVTCMASVHVPIVMLVGHYLLGVEIHGIKQAIGLYLVCVPAVAFLNTFSWVLLNKFSS